MTSFLQFSLWVWSHLIFPFIEFCFYSWLYFYWKLIKLQCPNNGAGNFIWEKIKSKLISTIIWEERNIPSKTMTFFDVCKSYTKEDFIESIVHHLDFFFYIALLGAKFKPLFCSNFVHSPHLFVDFVPFMVFHHFGLEFKIRFPTLRLQLQPPVGVQIRISQMASSLSPNISEPLS